MKKIIVLAIIIAALCIYLINNHIAENLKNSLLEIPLPPNTEIVDSISVTGKVAGNGNGMQYFGAILLRSESDADALEAYYADYAAEADWLEVGLQESEYLFEYRDYRFDHWNADEPLYCVGLWKVSVSGFEDSFGEALLNLDLRGH